MVTQSAEILKQSVLEVNSSTFDALALDIFRFQAEQNPVYRRYLQYLGIDPSQINSILSIPFLP